MKTKSSNQKGFAPVALVAVLVVLVVAGLLVYQNSRKNTIGENPSSTTGQQSFFSKLLGQKPSQPAGMILEAKTTKSIDSKTGASGVETSIFSTKDPVIYAVLTVNQPPKGTKFEYVRYFKSKYVDHQSLEVTKAGIDYVSFRWGLKDTKSTRLAGDYTVKLYTNGNFEKEISYQVR